MHRDLDSSLIGAASPNAIHISLLEGQFAGHCDLADDAFELLLASSDLFVAVTARLGPSLSSRSRKNDVLWVPVGVTLEFLSRALGAHHSDSLLGEALSDLLTHWLKRNLLSQQSCRNVTPAHYARTRLLCQSSCLALSLLFDAAFLRSRRLALFLS